MSITAISSLKSLAQDQGLVILPRFRYDSLLKRLSKQMQNIKRIKQEAYVDQIILQGEKELTQRETIQANSSKQALKKYYARQNQ